MWEPLPEAPIKSGYYIRNFCYQECVLLNYYAPVVRTARPYAREASVGIRSGTRLNVAAHIGLYLSISMWTREEKVADPDIN